MFLTKGINWSDLFSIPSTIWRQNENHFPSLHTSRFSLQFYMIDVAFLYTQCTIKGNGWHCQKILRLHHWIGLHVPLATYCCHSQGYHTNFNVTNSLGL